VFRTYYHASADCRSPFSQKNIQQCRCGTGSCRGVLGPKPKKPIEDRPLVPTLIAGTKRKVQDLMAAGRAASEDSHLSPKRRKICFEDSATTKAKNANSQSEAAGDRLRREAAEHSRQIASRQNRAMNRSKSVIGSRRPRSTHVRTQLPSIRSTRLTTVSFKRKGPKASGLKAISQPVRSHVVAQYPKMASPGTDSRASGGRPTTPKVLDSDQEEDVSLNITPASLRSASRKFGQSSLTLRKRSPTGSGSNRTRNLGMYTVSESKVQRRLDNSR
jgi:palmitoyltransferase ZDHHC9/14/18